MLLRQSNDNSCYIVNTVKLRSCRLLIIALRVLRFEILVLILRTTYALHKCV